MRLTNPSMLDDQVMVVFTDGVQSKDYEIVLDVPVALMHRSGQAANKMQATVHVLCRQETGNDCVSERGAKLEGEGRG